MKTADLGSKKAMRIASVVASEACPRAGHRMKTGGTPYCYISGPHSRDYYLLLDEQSGYIFATRLAARIREARGLCDEHAGLATASLPEIWIDDTEKHVWYVFEASRQRRGDG